MRSVRSARAEDEAVHLDGRGEQALIGADDVEGVAVGEGEREEAGVGGVDDAEAVGARLDVEEGLDLAVDEHGVAEELLRPGTLVGRDWGSRAGRAGSKLRS